MNPIDLETISRALNALCQNRCEDRLEWLRVGMAIHSATGGSEAGFQLWDNWSQLSERYKPGCTRTQWKSFKPGGKIGPGTLFRMANEDSPGWRSSVTPYKQPIPAPAYLPPAKPYKPTQTFPSPEKAIDVLATQFERLPDFQWEYLDAEWEPCGYVLRWNNPKGKTFRPVSRLHSGEWIIGHMPELRPLYRMPYLRELSDDTPIWIGEGEKTADAIISIGLPATTSSGGAQAARLTEWRVLAGRQVHITPDNDSAGEKYAHEVSGILRKLTPPATVKIVRLPGGPKSDACNFITSRKKQYV